MKRIEIYGLFAIAIIFALVGGYLNAGVDGLSQVLLVISIVIFGIGFLYIIDSIIFK